LAARRGKGREANKRRKVGPGGTRKAWRRSSGGTKPNHGKGTDGDAKPRWRRRYSVFQQRRGRRRLARVVL
jgi:hypothetical protein